MNWLREHMKQIIWITVTAFVLTIFASWGMGGFGGGNREPNLATINGKSVTLSRFQKLVNQVREEYSREDNSGIEEAKPNKIRREAFRRLVNEVLLQQAAQRHGGEASNEEIRQLVASQFRNEAGKINRRQFQRFLKQLPPERRKRIETQEKKRLEKLRLRSWLRDHLAPGDLELEKSLETTISEADLHGLFRNPRKYISRSRIKDYYQNNQDQFQTPPQARLRQIVLGSPEDTAGVGGPDYSKIRELRQRIRRHFQTGTPFDELARQYSEDASTAESGGRLGWVTPNDLPSALSRTAFDLEPGQMSELTSAGDSYYFLYLEEPIKRELIAFEKARPEITEKLLADTHWEQARSEIESLSEQLRSSENRLKKIKELASNSHGFTARNNGSYGWVPVRFLPDYISREQRMNWKGELIPDTNAVQLPRKISQTLLKLKSNPDSTVSRPVKTSFGVHLFAAIDWRPGRLEELTTEEREQFTSVLRGKKLNQYVKSWLKWRRKNISIELAREELKERIGGKNPEEIIQ